MEYLPIPEGYYSINGLVNQACAIAIQLAHEIKTDPMYDRVTLPGDINSIRWHVAMFRERLDYATTLRAKSWIGFEIRQDIWLKAWQMLRFMRPNIADGLHTMEIGWELAHPISELVGMIFVGELYDKESTP